MDFGKLFDTCGPANAGAWLTLNAPDGQPTPFKLKLAGEDSDRFREMRHEIANRRLLARKSTAELLESQALDLLAACTLDWEGIEGECTFANARALYAQYPEAARQADRFIGDHRNYLPRADEAPQAVSA